MSRNRVQFQKSLSEPEFEALYGTEALCIKAVVAARWPKGFVCPRCAHPHAHALTTRALFQCAKCRSQTSLIAGTIFQSTKLPLRIGFRALYHLTQAKNGVSALSTVATTSAACSLGFCMQACERRPCRTGF